MPVVEIPRGVTVQQIEFPDTITDGKKSDGSPKTRKFDRSCVGSLHVSPGIKIVTRDELTYLKDTKEYKKLYRRLRVVGLTAEESEAAAARNGG